MDKRLKLQKELEELIGGNAYFQPPASIRLAYPCVIYNLAVGDIRRADNTIYTYTNRFELLFIFKQPNMGIIEKVMRTFTMCSISRIYIADNLYHYAFNLYY